MAPADRDPTWIRQVAERRGLRLHDLSTSDHQHFRLEGDLGPAGGNLPWSCAAHRVYLADGGAEDWVEWTCPDLRATTPAHQLYVGFGGAGGLGSSGDAATDLARLGAGLAAAVLRRRRRAPARAGGGDVLELCEVEDPLGLVAGDVRTLICHWPVPDVRTASWARAAQRALGGPDLPPDAPPHTLRVGMSVQAPLTIMTRDWWQRAPWLDHQLALGCAVGRAVAATRPPG